MSNMSHLNKKCSETSSSSFDQDDGQSEEKKVQNFSKHMLLGRLFIGTFQEKRYVVNLNSYRDVILISKDEHDLIHDLEVVRKRIQGYYSFNHWIGITTPDIIGAPVGHCIWVELDSEVFGSYWYKIKSIKFRHNEVVLRLKVLRSISAIDNSPVKLSAATNDEEQFRNAQNLDLAKTYIAKHLTNFFTTIVTIHNFKEALIFLSLLVATIATGMIQIIKYLAEYFLKLLHETSNFIKSSTPVMIAVINLLGRTIGGLYLLIATLWRDRNVTRPPIYQPQYVYNQKQMITYHEYDARQRPALGVGSSVVITPLD